MIRNDGGAGSEEAVPASHLREAYAKIRELERALGRTTNFPAASRTPPFAGSRIWFHASPPSSSGVTTRPACAGPGADLCRLASDAGPSALAYITQARALLHLAEGQLQLDDALTLARKAIEFGVESRFRLELGAAQRVLGQVLEASGDREQPGAAPAQSPVKLEEIQSLPEPGRPCSRTGTSSWVTMPPRAGA